VRRVARPPRAAAALALVGTLSERQRSALLMRELAGIRSGHRPGPRVTAIAPPGRDRRRRALDEARAGSRWLPDTRRLGAGRAVAPEDPSPAVRRCRAHDRRLRPGACWPRDFPSRGYLAGAGPPQQAAAASWPSGLGAAALPSCTRLPSPRPRCAGRPARRHRAESAAACRAGARPATRTKAAARGASIGDRRRPAPVAVRVPAPPHSAGPLPPPSPASRRRVWDRGRSCGAAAHVLARVLSTWPAPRRARRPAPSSPAVASTVDTVVGGLHYAGHLAARTSI